MKKSKIADVLIELWNCLDQTGYDVLVIEALRNLPAKRQLELIEEWLDNGTYDTSRLSIYPAELNIVKKKAESLLSGV